MEIELWLKHYPGCYVKNWRLVGGNSDPPGEDDPGMDVRSHSGDEATGIYIGVRAYKSCSCIGHGGEKLRGYLFLGIGLKVVISQMEKNEVRTDLLGWVERILCTLRWLIVGAN